MNCPASKPLKILLASPTFCVLKSVHSGTLELINILVDIGFSRQQLCWLNQEEINYFVLPFEKKKKTPKENVMAPLIHSCHENWDH